MAVSVALSASFKLWRSATNSLRPCVLAARSYAPGPTPGLPDPPKRPPSSYIRFAMAKRESLVSANPGIRIGELGKATGELWRHLPADERERYTLEAKGAFQQYRVDYQKYLESLSKEEKAKLEEQRELRRKTRAKLKKKKILQELNKPRPHALTSFNCFVMDNKLEPGQTATQYLSGLAAMWRRMPEDDKEKYVQQASTNRQRYHEDMEDWEKQMIITGHPELVRGYRLPKPKKKKTAKKPAKEPAAAAKTSNKTKTKKAKSTGNNKKKTTSGSSKGKKTKDKQTQTDPDPSWMREE